MSILLIIWAWLCAGATAWMQCGSFTPVGSSLTPPPPKTRMLPARWIVPPAVCSVASQLQLQNLELRCQAGGWSNWAEGSCSSAIPAVEGEVRTANAGVSSTIYHSTKTHQDSSFVSSTIPRAYSKFYFIFFFILMDWTLLWSMLWWAPAHRMALRANCRKMQED